MHGPEAPADMRSAQPGRYHGPRDVAAAAAARERLVHWLLVGSSVFLLTAFTNESTPTARGAVAQTAAMHGAAVGDTSRSAADHAPVSRAAARPGRSSLPTDASPFFAGAFLGDGASRPEKIATSLRAYAQLVGAQPALIKTFYSLRDDFGRDGWAGRVLRQVVAEGTTNYVALAPTWSGSPDTGLLAAIVAGEADALLRRVARDFADIGEVVLVELGWEMNGDWSYAWQGSANGADVQAAARFVSAWRPIVDVFRSEGADNVRWVFAPNVGNPVAGQGTGPEHWNWYGHYYPGDAYVDYVGVHGFNAPELWGGAHREPAALFDGDGLLTELAFRFPSKPIIVGEFATEEVAGRDKGAWIESAFQYLTAQPNVVGAVWFNMKKETDWQVDSSPSALAAFRGVLRGPRIRTAFAEQDLPTALRLASR